MRTGETERTSTIVRHVVARKIVASIPRRAAAAFKRFDISRCVDIWIHCGTRRNDFPFDFRLPERRL